MEVVTLKRQRDEEETSNLTKDESFKRQKSYEDILTILDEEEEEPNQDLSSLITTLQQEISSSSSSSSSSEEDQLSLQQIEQTQIPTEQEDESERMMKHLLEASDDELGIPNTEAADSGGSEAWPEIGAGDLMVFPAGEGEFGDGLLWEIEDEAANYYALLQSELFM